MTHCSQATRGPRVSSARRAGGDAAMTASVAHAMRTERSRLVVTRARTATVDRTLRVSAANYAPDLATI